MTAMKPCPKCHSTEHLTDRQAVKVGCTGCHAFAQVDYVPTGPSANECRPDGVQSTRKGIERWNGHCGYWEGIFNHD